jgi:hypothetical protein
MFTFRFIAVGFGAWILWCLSAVAGMPDATTILQAIHARDRGKDLIWEVTIDLIDRNGSTRQRTGKIFRRTLPDNRNEQVTVFLSPANIRNTALLEVETEANDDYMWLYIPALKATKRIPPSGRGDKFVGTDFTMEDVNLGFKYQDYIGIVQQTSIVDGHPIAIMRIEPQTADLKQDIGFDYSIATVRTDQYIIIDQHFYQNEREIRHNQALDIRNIDGIWTPMEIRSVDLVNDHHTVLKLQTAKYNSNLSDALFRKEALAREMYR